ncbi:MAG TPA: hypothetical protein VF290_10330 [Pyrinomonadaceae bacterium]
MTLPSEGVVPDSVFSISTVPRIILDDGKVDMLCLKSGVTVGSGQYHLAVAGGCAAVRRRLA